MRVLASALSILFLTAVHPMHAVQAAEDAEAASRAKINLSGRQRMLTQRMTAATCLATAGADRAHRIEVARASHMDFDKALHGLQHGDASLGLPNETNAAVLAAFAEVEAVWSVLGPAVQQLVAGDNHSIVLGQLLRLNLPALKTSNAAVQEIVAAYGGGDLDPALARAIDVAGRQRMLSQKMMKEACFVSIGLGAEASAQALLGTIDLFANSLLQLQRGDSDAGIAPPPTPDVAQQLRAVEALWGDYRTGLIAALESNGDGIRVADLTALAAMADEVLAASHQAVLRYVEATP